LTASSPEEVSTAFAAAINAGDVTAALALWGEDAVVVGLEGHAIAGRAAIEAALEALVASSTTVEIDVSHIYPAGNIAVAVGTLTLNPGNGSAHRSSSVVVYSRAADGSWRVAIDAPWGLPAAHQSTGTS
jgi:uncharacterized protein (TIGR02246 family)